MRWVQQPCVCACVRACVAGGAGCGSRHPAGVQRSPAESVSRAAGDPTAAPIVPQTQDCGKPFYVQNYVAFFAAIRARYPHMRLVSNCDMGQVQGAVSAGAGGWARGCAAAAAVLCMLPPQRCCACCRPAVHVELFPALPPQDGPTDVWDWHIYTNPTGVCWWCVVLWLYAGPRRARRVPRRRRRLPHTSPRPPVLLPCLQTCLASATSSTGAPLRTLTTSLPRVGCLHCGFTDALVGVLVRLWGQLIPYPQPLPSILASRPPPPHKAEYAVTDGGGWGNVVGAVSEAAFMTGMERNGDVVLLGAYVRAVLRCAVLCCAVLWLLGSLGLWRRGQRQRRGAPARRPSLCPAPPHIRPRAAPPPRRRRRCLCIGTIGPGPPT